MLTEEEARWHDLEVQANDLLRRRGDLPVGDSDVAERWMIDSMTLLLEHARESIRSQRPSKG